MPSIQPWPNHPLEVLKSLLSLKSWHAIRTHYLAQQDWEKSRQSKESKCFSRFLPWWSYSASSFVDQVVPTNYSVLELGSGYSTLWWLTRGNTVVAIENNPSWASKVSNMSDSLQGELQMLVENPSKTDAVAPLLNGKTFDVLVIDHSGDRTTAVIDYLPFLSETGYVIFDNSDRPEYQEGLHALIDAGFSKLDFFGLGPINAYGSQTSFFYKDSFGKSHGRVQDFGIIDY